jgi:hypothetical protein
MVQRSREQSHDPVPRSGLSTRRSGGSSAPAGSAAACIGCATPSRIPTTQQSMATAALRRTFLQPDRARGPEASLIWQHYWHLWVPSRVPFRAKMYAGEVFFYLSY